MLMFDVGVKETQCTSCSHRDVCSLKERFLEAQNAIDNLNIYSQSKKEEPVSIIALKNIDWIKPVQLSCTHYFERKEVVYR